MNIRTKLLSAGLATAVTFGGLVSAPIASAETASAQSASAKSTTETKSSSIKNLSSSPESPANKTSSFFKETDPDTVLEWLGVVTAGLSVIATVYTMMNSMNNNANVRF